MRLAWLFSTLALVSGCGILGKNDAVSRNMSYADPGMACLDGFSETLAQYKEGTLAEAQWQKSMDCVNNSLETFQKFVTPSAAEGYSLSEMHLFVSKFLLTTAPVSQELVRGIFEFKAALLGGPTDRISPAELNRLLSNLEQIKEISSEVLTALRRVRRDPTDENWIRFSDVAREAGQKMAALLPAEAFASVSLQTIEAFVNEARNFGVDIDPRLARAGLAIKKLLVGGSDQEIEPDSWREFARLIGRAIGPLGMITQSQENGSAAIFDRREVFTETLNQVAAILRSSMAYHGGVWPLALFDQIIDNLPSAWLPARAQVVKSTLRPLTQKILGSRTRDAIDESAVQIVLTFLDDWSRGSAHINQLFSIIGRDSVSWAELISMSQAYQDQLSDPRAKADAARLVSLIKFYQPILSAGDGMISLHRGQNYTKAQLSQVHWTNLMAKRFLKAYAAPRGNGTISQSDLANFFGDFMDFAADVHFLDPTTIDMPARRFRDMDLFTLASDGNGELNEQEVTYFLTYIVSIGNLSKRISDSVVPRCPRGAKDPFGTYYVTKDCFIYNYFSQHQSLWDHFPKLSSYYSSLSSSQRAKTESEMEISSRRYGISDLPVGGIDIQGYSGLIHYAETIMARFDRNEDGILVLDEVLAAYPVFKRILAETGKLDMRDDALIQAVLTYIVKYQEIPKQDLKFITWYASRPFWKLNADRGGLFNLISKISTPEPIPASGNP
ncbi:hypothetical protein EBZ37_06540 [bacterium]|nr:hypothetical protein [bacterium]